MQKSRVYQKHLKEKLEKYFKLVKKEWSVSNEATDAFTRDIRRYSPRLDVAVGPFSVSAVNHVNELWQTFNNRAPSQLKKLVKGLNTNENPRCVLAIEVVFSGSSKHILGDITNASLMGIYGIVVAYTKMLAKTERIFEYIKTVKELGKAPPEIFKNVLIISSDEFLALL